MRIVISRTTRSAAIAASRIVSILFCTMGSVSAQQPPSLPDLQQKEVALTVQKISLEEVVTALSKQIGRNILVDGLPLWQQADFNFKGTAKETLDRVADTFDYTWTLSKRGVILMHKRFKNPDEYPQMNLPELRQMAKEAVAALRFLEFDSDPSHEPVLLSTLYHSFTPEQIQTLQSGKILYGRELAPQQQHTLQQYHLNGYFADARTVWDSLRAQLDAMPKSYLQCREWPTFYQKRQGDPVAPVPKHPNYLEFDYIYQNPKGLGRDIKEGIFYITFQRTPQEKKP